jgi:hypothetical protein
MVERWNGGTVEPWNRGTRPLLEPDGRSFQTLDFAQFAVIRGIRVLNCSSSPAESSQN